MRPVEKRWLTSRVTAPVRRRQGQDAGAAGWAPRAGHPGVFHQSGRETMPVALRTHAQRVETQSIPEPRHRVAPHVVDLQLPRLEVAHALGDPAHHLHPAATGFLLSLVRRRRDGVGPATPRAPWHGPTRRTRTPRCWAPCTWTWSTSARASRWRPRCCCRGCSPSSSTAGSRAHPAGGDVVLTLGVLVVQNRTYRVYAEEEIEALQTTAMVLAEFCAILSAS